MPRFLSFTNVLMISMISIRLSICCIVEGEINYLFIILVFWGRAKIRKEARKDSHLYEQLQRIEAVKSREVLIPRRHIHLKLIQQIINVKGLGNKVIRKVFGIGF